MNESERNRERERESEEKQLLTIYWKAYLFNLGVSPRARFGASFRTSSWPASGKLVSTKLPPKVGLR